MRCKNCGRNLKEGARFCMFCGQETADYEESDFFEEEPRIRRTRPDIKRSEAPSLKVILLTATGVFVVILLILISFISARRSSDKFIADNNTEVETAGTPIVTKDIPDEPEYVDTEIAQSEIAKADETQESSDIEEQTESGSATESSDMYGMYTVTEDWLEKNKIMGLFLQRDGALYSVSSLVPVSVVDKEGVGCRLNNDTATLYLNDGVDIMNINTSTPVSVLSCGDFPIFTVHKNEKLLGRNIKELELIETFQTGYTIEIYKSDYGIGNVMDHMIPRDFIIDDSNIGVNDLNDVPVDDFRNLDHGGQYIFSWYAGTQYNESRKTADCRCYKRTERDDPKKYNIEGTLTKTAFAEFDLSDVDPGIYIVPNGLELTRSVIEIVD